jgi:hypothetical protein
MQPPREAAIAALAANVLKWNLKRRRRAERTAASCAPNRADMDYS